MTYKEQLKDARWKIRRQEIIDKANGICEWHRDPEIKATEVHHGCYIKGKMAWEYPDEVLYALCSECHYNIQEQMEQAQFEIGRRMLDMVHVIGAIKHSAETRDLIEIDLYQ